MAMKNEKSVTFYRIMNGTYEKLGELVSSMLTLHDDGMLGQLYYFELFALDEHWRIHKSNQDIVLNDVDSVESRVEMDLNLILSRLSYSHCWCLKFPREQFHINREMFKSRK